MTPPTRNEEDLEQAGYEIKRSDNLPEVPDPVVAPVGKGQGRRSCPPTDTVARGRGARPASASPR